MTELFKTVMIYVVVIIIIYYCGFSESYMCGYSVVRDIIMIFLISMALVIGSRFLFGMSFNPLNTIIHVILAYILAIVIYFRERRRRITEQ